MLIVIVLAGCPGANAKDFRTLDHLQPSATNDIQTDAAQELILRVVKARASSFVVNVDPSIGPTNRDTFRLITDSGRLNITGTTGVAVAMGFYYYLAQYCGCHISWGGNQVNFPSELPVIAAPGVVVTSNDKLRYFSNVCTMSYSFAWWRWSHWEPFIDWLAMSGFNMPLAFNGQEAIWQRVYIKMGFNQTDLDKNFAGPAFLAWQRMGNMYGWGGPLPQNWHLQQVVLQHKILARMRSLGMVPVLPAFAGHVPRAFPRLFPGHNVIHMHNWGHFNTTYCCTFLLSAEDPLFAVIGKAFLLEYRTEFGTDHLYNADNFNEMPPATSDPKYIAAFGKATFNSMLAADQDAIWVMQSWLFQEKDFWKPPQAKALLTSVPLGRMIVLDLSSEVKPTYNSLESYFGQPFIWCMLHDYGGVVDWYGMVDSINKGPFVGRSFPNSTMVGIGLTMEGINQNYVIYEFMNENLWRKQPRDVDKWFSSYAFRRYGVYEASMAKAWVLLAHSIYNCTTSCQWHGQDTIIIEKPRYQNAVIPRVWYNVEDLFGAWDLFVTSASPSMTHSALYRYDLVDLTRQSLEVIANKFYSDLLTHYKAKDLSNTISSGLRLLGLLADLETLLASDEHFLLGRWLEDAKALGTTDAEKQLYEYNARNQITLWGPRANVLDYANKQWSGMVKSFYQPRWALFVERLVQSLEDKAPFDEAKFNKDVFSQVEQPFTYDRTLWPTQPTGDAVELARQIHKSYRPATVKYADFFRRLQRPQTSSKTGHSYEYVNSVHQGIMYDPDVELRVVDDASDSQLIL